MKVRIISSIFIFFAFFLSSQAVSAAVAFPSFQTAPKSNTYSAFKSATSTPIAKKTPGYVSNQVNLDGFLSKVRENGKYNPQIESIVGQMKIDTATTTDLMGLFLSQKGIIPINAKDARISHSNPLAQKFLSFVNPFRPKQALAVSTLPFGGPLWYSYYCTCSFTWLIWVGPTASVGTSNMILDYVPFSQGYLAYNIPYTSLLMGKYTPSSSMCYIYYGYGCINVPVSYGMITPLVGSSVR